MKCNNCGVKLEYVYNIKYDVYGLVASDTTSRGITIASPCGRSKFRCRSVRHFYELGWRYSFDMPRLPSGKLAIPGSNKIEAMWSRVA